MLTLFVSSSAGKERDKDGKAGDGCTSAWNEPKAGRNRLDISWPQRGLQGPGVLSSGVCCVTPDQSFDLPMPL